MKRILVLFAVSVLLLCSCGESANKDTDPKTNTAETQNGGEITADTQSDKRIVGKWIDVKTEGMVEYTENGFYYEGINEIYTTDKTRYIASGGKIYYYLDGDDPASAIGIDYEIKNGNLIIAGEIEYKPIDIKTSAEETD